jgi:hypothetical protein
MRISGAGVTEKMAYAFHNARRRKNFIDSLKRSTSASTPDKSFPTFLFADSDVCPTGGCEAGCSGSSFGGGNGYFRVFHTA